MNVNKRNNYQLTGSIHTLSLISLPVTDIDESIAPCFDTLSSRENLSYSKINANKLVGDLFSYDEFKTAFDTIMKSANNPLNTTMTQKYTEKKSMNSFLHCTRMI